jgi:hypothetical protein
MTYRLTESPGWIQRTSDGAHFFVDPASADYQEYLSWLSKGNVPGAAVATPPPPPPADWAGLLVALRDTNVFARLRGQARLNVEANAVATELRTLLGEAALGLVQADAIQALITDVAPTIPEGERDRLRTLFARFRVPLTL